MPFLVLANFKSHKTIPEVKSWLETIVPVFEQYQDQLEVIIAPSFPHLHLLSSSLNSCAQDVSPFPPGAYTGAVNAPQLKDLGVKYCLVGHSERRHFFHETHQDVANKVSELLGVGITPVLLLSEKDIVPQFAALDDSLVDRCLYCFEPPSDIGGTTTAPLDVITQVIGQIRAHTPAPLLYGGSVTPQNIANLLPLNLSGVLVATASLETSSFNSILEVIAHAR
ncbi:TPA: hypothetical protein DD448_02270 [Candidatus Collierbacteria bacterium]|uniref:Triosephosphate isomerase n=2 Tax=Candidatus Collieribacteriota TaxID=1752725 RepID=A0A1F5FZQ5_9BACT|nr:MAG: triosephosphate isomerase [Microgenomates group bacterium GW2011_GWF1_46_12]KKU27447.1 MAG: triosephosphate isomerase [Microgenomates group bacterium GW2011_GWF2_46_18]KKU45177.1 MAG: triosephosphate isomerase [Microgenomates group bacterium GW2011_GWB1_46_7]KKU60682.1 MAG: triosephosphate isomerase [Microgenomates group bacterium GW2011_GWE1_47_12]KKU62285.1 MAG: triosephosphate isomerase [Microgenomates group bacterium GW2011_GWD1_47_13]OGD70442.1 MAG: hypothetical protein A2187_0124